MKKLFIYFLIFIFICFIIPAICTKTTSKETVSKEVTLENKTQNISNINENIQQDNKQYNYTKYGTIKLLHIANNQIEEVPIDEYLYNVVSAEMPANFEIEALKAQAVVARTYTIYQIINNGNKHENANICDSSKCCQAWISKQDRLNRWEESVREQNWKRIEEVVNKTKGEIITYNNQPINAFFHSNSGGTTEMPVNVWGGTGYPYLQSVQTSGEEGYTQYASEVEISNNDILKKLQQKYPNIKIDLKKEDDIKILDYTNSGRVRTIKFGNTEISGVEARTIFELKSANFEIIKSPNSIKFKVKGYGHGVGMSQTGADSLAKNGSNYKEIIKHFYSNVEIKDVNSI